MLHEEHGLTDAQLASTRHGFLLEGNSQATDNDHCSKSSLSDRATHGLETKDLSILVFVSHFEIFSQNILLVNCS